MNVSSIDVKDMLEAESSLGLVFGTDLFIGGEPPNPNSTVTIFDTPGKPTALSMDGASYEYPSVQVRVRESKYLDAAAKAEEIKSSLHGRAQETWNGTLYSVIICSSGPAFLDYDENKRARFIINFNLQRR